MGRWLAIVAVLLAAFAAAAVLPGPDPTGEHAYGAHPRHRLDFWPAAEGSRAPAILFVHGGGWSRGAKGGGGRQKPSHFASRGYAYASVGYRLVPGATVEEQARDIAAAIAWLRANARRLGIDRDRIVLMGHSSGGHLAALVGSDPGWLRGAGVPFASVRAVVLLDGAGYDVTRVIERGGSIVERYYRPAFGADRARQARLSPVSHAGRPNARAWLLLYDAGRMGAGAAAEGFARQLRAAGTSAELVGVAGTTHMDMVNRLGFEGDFATQAIDDFLDAEVAR